MLWGVLLSLALIKGNFKMKNWHFLITYILDLNIRIFSNILYFLFPIYTNLHRFSGMEKPVNCYLKNYFK